MATSKVSIANGALGRLGSPKRLESLTQDHPHARTMNKHIDKVLRAEMRRYDWSFAIKRDSIAADADEPVWGDWNRYTIPGDYLRLLRDDESGAAVDFKIEGGYILSRNAAPLEIRYLAFIEDPTMYDSLFIDAVECALAQVTAQEVTGSTSIKESLKDDYKTAVADAKKFGSIEKGAVEFPEDDWISVRY